MTRTDSFQEWLLARLGRGRAAKATPVCYLRENGPIAYALALFDAEARDHVEAMLASDLAWHWKSSARDWTQLTRWSLAALLTDLTETLKRDSQAAEQQRLTVPSEYPLQTLIVGLDASETPGDVSNDMAVAWIETFASARGGPLHVVIARPSVSEDMVFVAQHPPETVRTLLHGWGIDRDRAERRAYARLREHSLERVAERLAKQP
jgi:hypothetical protein